MLAIIQLDDTSGYPDISLTNIKIHSKDKFEGVKND
jgi:hypothetical protein